MCVVCLLFVKSLRFMTKPMSDCLLMLRNERWKRVRSILTPAFSASKMKEVRSIRVWLVQLKSDVVVFFGEVSVAEWACPSLEGGSCYYLLYLLLHTIAINIAITLIIL